MIYTNTQQSIGLNSYSRDISVTHSSVAQDNFRQTTQIDNRSYRVTLSSKGIQLSKNQFDARQRSDKTSFENRLKRESDSKIRELEAEKKQFERKQASEQKQFEAKQRLEKANFDQNL